MNVWSAGGELFTGLYSDYWGRDAAVFRSMNRPAHLRTEPDNERLLKGVGGEGAESRGVSHGWTISGLHGIIFAMQILASGASLAQIKVCKT